MRNLNSTRSVKSSALLVAISLSGCSSLSTYERSWQTMNALDWSQTMHIAREPTCYREVGSAELIGEHPSEGEVAALAAAYSLGHLWINRELEARAERNAVWHWTWRFFQASSFLITSRNVANNHRIGLRPFGSGC